MAKRNSEFRPDRTRGSFFSRFFLTKKQRGSLLKWSLYSLLLLAASLVQDVMLCQVRILGATTELVPCLILIICLVEGAEAGSVFCLVASACYVFSGSSPGYYVMPATTFIALILTMFRQGYLRCSFGTTLVCAAVGILVYEMLVFGVEFLAGHTQFDRVMVFVMKGLLSAAVIPILYPLAAVIEKIGGETWKE